MESEDSSDVRDQQFVLLMTRHQAALGAFVRSLAPDRSMAEEVLQATTVVLWQKRNEFTLGTNFRAWAFKVARFQIMAHRQKLKRSKVLCFDDEVVEKLSDSAAALFEQADERIEALEGCLEKLPEGDRVLIEDCYFEPMSLTQQAERAGRSIGALRQVLYRIRTALRRCVEQSLGQGDSGPGKEATAG